MIENDDTELKETYERVEATEAAAISVAVRHVAMHAPFVGAPTGVIDRNIADFQRIAATNAVSQAEMIRLAERNLSIYVGKLRPQTVIYSKLDAVRLSVLAHVALVIGLPSLRACQSLWSAIGRAAWEDAADELMMTKWPERAKDDDDRRRILELARMMRNGDEPPAWTN